MRLFILALALVGCTGVAPQETAPSCKNIVVENWAGVPFQWDVMDTEDVTTMTDGCTYTSITHYVLDDGSGGAGAGGSAPDPRHCDVDACGGPLDKRITYSDPVPEFVGMPSDNGMMH